MNRHTAAMHIKKIEKCILSQRVDHHRTAIVIGGLGSGKLALCRHAFEDAQGRMTVSTPNISKTYVNGTIASSLLAIFDHLFEGVFEGEHTIVIFNEFSQASSGVQNEIIKLIKTGKIGEQAISKNVTFLFPYLDPACYDVRKIPRELEELATIYKL